MRVDFYALLRPLAGSDSNGRQNFELPDGADTQALLAAILRRFPAMRPHLLDETGAGLRSDVPIFVNGRNPRLAEQGLKQALPPDSVISIFSPIASGRMNVAGLRPAATTGQEEKNES